jgi:NAD-dependent deacetylase
MKIIFFTGAGISQESGIPTFDEQTGIRDKLTRDFALYHTDEYKEVIKQMKESCDKAEPNAAHKAIAELGCPVITMNIDGLHQRAGSKNVLAIHGRLPYEHELNANNFKWLLNIPVLYGDRAPMYQEAMDMVQNLDYGDSYFIIVGVSFYTSISNQLKKLAEIQDSKIIIINQNATIEVSKLIKELGSKIK